MEGKHNILRICSYVDLISIWIVEQSYNHFTFDKESHPIRNLLNKLLFYGILYRYNV